MSSSSIVVHPQNDLQGISHTDLSQGNTGRPGGSDPPTTRPLAVLQDNLAKEKIVPKAGTCLQLQ